MRRAEAREVTKTVRDRSSADLAARKGALRRSVLAARADMTSGQLTAAGELIAARVLSLPVVATAGVVAGYLSIGTEVPTGPLISALHHRSTTIIAPLLRSDNSLAWAVLQPGAALDSGPKGLFEPARDAERRPLADAAVVIVPGVCFDETGKRLGRGGGSYDRALHDLPATIVTIGLALDRDIVGAVPTDAHDQQVHIIVTPTRVIVIDDGGH